MQINLSPEAFAGALADAVVATDAQGVIRWWNQAAEKLFGHSAGAAIGQTLDLITPERFRSRHWQGYHEAMDRGSSRYGDKLLRVPALHASGAGLSIAFTVSLLKNEQGQVDGVVAVIRDETQRFEEDKALRARLAQLQAQSTGQQS